MPRSLIELDERKLGITRDELLERLRNGDPGIVLAPAGRNGVYVNPQTLEPGQSQVILEKIEEVLDGAAP